MANKLHLKHIDLSEDWSDDIRMKFLYAAFRERSVNPEGWEAKMKFWVDFIEEFCLKCQTPLISHNILRSALERKGKFPQCLDIVLENMYNQGLITSLSNFSKLEPEKGWIGWGFDMIVQKPISWGFSSVQSLMKWTKKEDHFIVLSVVKALAAKLLQRHSELVSSELTDNISFFDTFEARCKDICSSVNFNLAVIQLQKDKHVYVFEDNGRKVIKFRNQDDKKVKPLSELDSGILNLQSAKDKVMNDIDSLEKDIDSHTNEIKQLIRCGYRTKAMFALKKKKRLEDVLKKKTVAFDNIESLLCQLQNSDSEKMVLAAYKAGVQAVKASMKDDFNLDNIDNTMAEVEGTLDDYEEVKKTLSKSVTPESESLDAFEDELNKLLAAEKPSTKKKEMSPAKISDDEDELNKLLAAEKQSTKKKEQSPARVSDDDLLKRLAALRSPPEGFPPVKKPAINTGVIGKRRIKLSDHDM